MTPTSYPEGGFVDCILDVADNGLSQNRAAQKRGGMPSRTEATQSKGLSMEATLVPTAPSSSSCMLMNAFSKKDRGVLKDPFPANDDYKAV
ncbi:hypothetical protein DER44DRAFT_798071, partial [Fusarium oxysporum]